MLKTISKAQLHWTNDQTYLGDLKFIENAMLNRLLENK